MKANYQFTSFLGNYRATLNDDGMYYVFNLNTHHLAGKIDGDNGTFRPSDIHSSFSVSELNEVMKLCIEIKKAVEVYS
jgi:hypothetical protein